MFNDLAEHPSGESLVEVEGASSLAAFLPFPDFRHAQPMVGTRKHSIKWLPRLSNYPQKGNSPTTTWVAIPPPFGAGTFRVQLLLVYRSSLWLFELRLGSL